MFLLARVLVRVGVEWSHGGLGSESAPQWLPALGTGGCASWSRAGLFFVDRYLATWILAVMAVGFGRLVSWPRSRGGLRRCGPAGSGVDLLLRTVVVSADL
ncbi:Hypothetical protein SCLAV_2582 [Streptomyces clavuligerus]|uniref:Uncharacterized protein n=1 Tax=Streptomyces clavuligerus TaxID=1901 RepID=E2Q9S7_STRCL|nr:Hypothetical protein SCLAV_2582 [Streptomyces clavuligerus]